MEPDAIQSTVVPASPAPAGVANFPKLLALGTLSRPLASSTRTEVIPELLVVPPGRCWGYVFSGCAEDAPRLGRPRRRTRVLSIWGQLDPSERLRLLRLELLGCHNPGFPQLANFE